MESQNIQGFIDALLKFDKLFDTIRIVDPVKKEVIYCYGDVGDSNQWTCYKIWSKGESCDHCVSMKALEKNDTVIKIEYSDAKTFMVMAIPVDIKNKIYVMEMVKDVTSTEIITEVNGKQKKETKNVIRELHKKAITDDLTGIYNRRYLNEVLPKNIIEARRNEKFLSLLMLDLDDFKHINDTYGHAAGDEVIKQLSSIVQSNIRRQQDWVARYGGEEFIVVLSDADKAIAYKISEKIRQELQETNIKYGEINLKVTVSIGAYTIKPVKEKIEEVLCKVDGNLYLAKRGGKNMTVGT